MLSDFLRNRYLMNNATKQLGKDVYSLSEALQGRMLVQQLEEYAKSHYWVSVLSLESVHRFGSIYEAKRILGPLLQIVYVDVEEEERIRRQMSAVSPTDVDEFVRELKAKDVTKRARGADKVKEIADLVLDNNGPLDSTIAVLRSHLQQFIQVEVA